MSVDHVGDTRASSSKGVEGVGLLQSGAEVCMLRGCGPSVSQTVCEADEAGDRMTRTDRAAVSNKLSEGSYR
jgi:hypothetical protein